VTRGRLSILFAATAAVVLAAGCASKPATVDEAPPQGAPPAADSPGTPSPATDPPAHAPEPDDAKPGLPDPDPDPDADADARRAEAPARGSQDAGSRESSSQEPGGEALGDPAGSPGGDARQVEAAEDQPRPPEDAKPAVLRPFPHVEVHLEEREVHVDSETCLDAGWLEFVACTPGTKEHESLVVTPAKPSHIHAALLMAGYEPGRPGQWHYDEEQISVTPPRGDRVDVLFRYEGEDGEPTTVPAREWIIDHLGELDFPAEPWVFAGSRMEKAPPQFGVEEIYVADYSGSVIGLATFGDELLGWSQVFSHDTTVQPAEWAVDTDDIPPIGTPVTVILRRHNEPVSPPAK